MRVTVEGVEAHVATGGRKHGEGKPWILFLHGAGSSHLSWALQTRAFAYDGWNVMAPDFPGHFLSVGSTGGSALEGIEAHARWVIALMDAVGAEQAVVAGHSMGGLVALEIARIAPKRVRAVILIGTAAAIPVNPALIEMAENLEEEAFASMTSWSYGPGAQLHENTWPGASHIFFNLDMMRRNPKGVLATDLKTCAAYQGGPDAARGLRCPSLCILAGTDRMTPLRNGRTLAEMLPDNEVVVVADSGHTLPTEKPRQVNAAIRGFLSRRLDGEMLAAG
ncbi:MAG: alpha/beta hydrolase [Salaquimonas sp.]|jgi:pimeloyl-ACP methyl ester carboxylesterase|nr:alpha/beta hydrolase [Salaquimonas sp.]